ncbi:MAG: hypothetical protein V1663_00010 [archaeon]
MKTVLILIVLLISLNGVYAFTEQIVIFKGDSFLMSNKNVTLIDVFEDEDTIVVCVNNQKAIVSNGETFNGVKFDIEDIKDNYIDVYLKTTCTDCICDENCLNDRCFNYVVYNQSNVNNLSNEVEQVQCYSDEDCVDGKDNTVDNCINSKCYNLLIEDIEGKEENPIAYISFFLFLLFALILGLFLLKKR